MHIDPKSFWEFPFRVTWLSSRLNQTGVSNVLLFTITDSSMSSFGFNSMNLSLHPHSPFPKGFTSTTMLSPSHSAELLTSVQFPLNITVSRHPRSSVELFLYSGLG